MDNTIIYNNLYIFLFSKAVSEYVEEGGLNKIQTMVGAKIKSSIIFPALSEVR